MSWLCVCCDLTIVQFFIEIKTHFLRGVVCPQVTADEDDSWTSSDDDDEGGEEYFVLEESTGYMAPTLCFLAVFHTALSVLCLIGYYFLKVIPII